jgi:hypothetical protein
MTIGVRSRNASSMEAFSTCLSAGAVTLRLHRKREVSMAKEPNCAESMVHRVTPTYQSRPLEPSP